MLGALNGVMKDNRRGCIVFVCLQICRKKLRKEKFHFSVDLACVRKVIDVAESKSGCGSGGGGGGVVVVVVVWWWCGGGGGGCRCGGGVVVVVVVVVWWWWWL